MGDYQQRVIDEGAELEGRLKKLEEFFKTQTYRELGVSEQWLLVHQRDVMAEYASILRKRIEAYSEVKQRER